METGPNWRSFYEELRSFGLEALAGVDPHIESFAEWQMETDAFYSNSLQIILKYWCDNPERAVRETLDIWAANVRSFLCECEHARLISREMLVFDSEREDDMEEPGAMIRQVRANLDVDLIDARVEAASEPRNG